MTGEALRAVLDRLGDLGPGGPAAPRVGIDLVHIPRAQILVEQHGPRWLADHFTERERAELAAVRGNRAATLAGRLAAKEAFIKLLTPVDRLVLTRDIEVLRLPGGAPEVHPRGTALRELLDRRIDRWTLSITHEGEWAAAIAIGCGPPHPTRTATRPAQRTHEEPS